MKRICPWCKQEFTTDNSQKFYCSNSHMNEAARTRRYRNNPERRRGNRVVPLLKDR